MATDNSAEILVTLRDLLDTMKTGSIAGSGFYGDPKKTHKQTLNDSNRDPIKAAADRLRLEKAMKEGTKALKDTFKSTENYAKDMKVASGMFQNAIGKLSLKAFDALPKRINTLTKDLGFQFQSTADIQKTLREGTIENITAAKGLHAQLLELELGSEAYNAKMRQIQKVWSQDVTLLALPTEKLQENFQKLGGIVNTTTKSIDNLGTSSNKASKAGTLLAEVLMYAAKRALDATIASAKFGVEILPLAKGMAALGISADEMGELQNKNFQAMKSSGTSFNEFTNTVIGGAYQLASFTGNMKDGAIIFGDAFRNFRMLSSSVKGQDKFISDTAKVFMLMHETVGTTVQQFQELTQQLISNNDIQVNMYRLNERQRTQAFQDLLVQDALLKTYGLLEPEAQAVVQTFAQIGAQGPKERLKQAAQLQAVGGALGMGAQARQLAEYIRKGDTQNPDAIRLAHELQVGAQRQYANVKGTAGEFAQYALTNIPGVQQILGQSGPVAALGTRAGMATPSAPTLTPEQAKTKAEDDKNRQRAVTAVVSINDQVKGISGLLTIIAATLAIPTLTKILGGTFGKMFGKMFGRGAAGAAAEGTLAGEAGVAGAGISGAGLAGAAGATLGVGAAAAGGYALGSAIDMIPKLFGSQENFSDMIGNILADKFGPKLAGGLGSGQQSKKDQVIHDIIQDRAKYEKGDLDAKAQKDMRDTLDGLTRELAIMNGKDPTKAVDDLHKTLKIQHQENKQMTQEQTDAIQHKKELKVIRTSNPIGPTT